MSGGGHPTHLIIESGRGAVVGDTGVRTVSEHFIERFAEDDLEKSDR